MERVDIFLERAISSDSFFWSYFRWVHFFEHLRIMQQNPCHILRKNNDSTISFNQFKVTNLIEQWLIKYLSSFDEWNKYIFFEIELIFVKSHYICDNRFHYYELATKCYANIWICVYFLRWFHLRNLKSNLLFQFQLKNVRL